MEIRDTDIGISRCDNHECNQLLLGIAIAFQTPHGEIEICSSCILTAKMMFREEERRIMHEEQFKTTLCYTCKFMKRHDGWDECTDERGGVGRSRKGYANTTHSGKCKYFSPVYDEGGVGDIS